MFKRPPTHEISDSPYASVPVARASLGRYLTFYNSGRPHSALDRRTLDQAYFNRPLLPAA